ncbi:hypothetical protein D9758_002775 [Tetrapyrgos nigripes]|uniref:F-box domain-containing protein n=1 Tax=Tetrapyrgos nigripes TaxID=182062 RepID=A0A8H5GQP2_9AGAR|nr:hypothetical protein D9758_002775 [Tetrapyrgos nigripes]
MPCLQRQPSMEWKKPFTESVAAFKARKYGKALKLLDQALERGGSQQYIVYDSRAAAHEKLGNTKEALLDIKKTIQLAPNRWQSYARAARLFRQVSMWEKALSMVDIALKKIPSNSDSDSPHRAELVILKEELVNSQKQSICHLAKLPVELLMEMFTLLVGEDFINVLLLSRICQHWRRITLNNPSFWDTLVLSKRRPGLKSLWWLQRSRGKIRELRLRASLNGSGWSFEDLKALRWEYLRICHVEDMDIVAQLKKLSKLHVLSQLEEYSLQDTALGDSWRPLVDLGPLLQRLRLENVRTNLADVPAHITSLTSLTLCNTSNQHHDCLYSVIASNPLLEHLTIDNIQFTTWEQNPPLTLSHLTSLELLRHSQMAFETIKLLSLPRLRNVVLQLCGAHAELFVKLFVDREYKELVEFTSEGNIVRASLFLQLLANNPSLESLTIKRTPGVAEPVLKALASPELCPNLHHLDLSYCPDVQTGPLLDLIKSRNPVITPSVPDNSSSSNTIATGSSSGRPPPSNRTESEASTQSSPLPAISAAAALVAPIERIKSLTVNGCPKVEPEFIPWFQKRVEKFSCKYSTKAEAAWKR